MFIIYYFQPTETPHPITGEIQVKKTNNNIKLNHRACLVSFSNCAFSSLISSQLQINYDRSLGNLIVHVLQARNLAPRDNDGYSDPFVKVYLLPGRGWAPSVLTHADVLSVSASLPLCLSCFMYEPCCLTLTNPSARLREWQRKWRWGQLFFLTV